MKLNREMVVHVAEASIIETVEAFVRFRPGFHGDTGIRDYLYHRLMTGLPDGGTHTRTDGCGTLLAQAEWYTVLKYRNPGNWRFTRPLRYWRCRSGRSRFGDPLPSNGIRVRAQQARRGTPWRRGRRRRARGTSTGGHNQTGA